MIIKDINNNKIILIIFILFLFIFFWLFKNNGGEDLSKSNEELRKKLDQKMKYIDELNNIIKENNKINIEHYALRNELYIRNNQEPLQFKLNKEHENKINNNDNFFIFTNQNDQLSSPINLHVNNFKGTGYLDIKNDTFFYISSKGIISYSNLQDINLNSDDIFFKQIKSNINLYLNEKLMKKHFWFSIKDILISNDNIYISYTNEIKKDCWNISILKAKINYRELKFEHFFSPTECISSKKDEFFNAHEGGGRLVDDNIDSIFLSTGSFSIANNYPQNPNSVFGKILKINKNHKNYEIVAMGLRNPQGLFYDDGNIWITDHGPKGGDEINLLKKNDIEQKKVINYGWPLVSYGAHYHEFYAEKSGLPKLPTQSHIDSGFEEPLYFFKDSIGISQIIKINNNLIIGSMKDKSIYHMTIDADAVNLSKKEFIFERIRDIIMNNNNIYLSLENTSSIGVYKDYMKQ